MRKLVILLVAGLLTGCLDLRQARVTPEHRQLMQKAALVVLLDPAPRLHHLRISPKDTTMTTVALEGWDAQALTTKFLAERMRGMGLDVKTPHFTHRELPNPYDSSMAYPNIDRMRGPLAEWGITQGVDMVVAVYRQVEKDFIGDSIENMVGYGLVRHENSRVDAYAAVYIDVVTTKSGSFIGNSDGLKNTPVDEALWQDAFNVDKEPVELVGAEATAVVEKVTEVLLAAVMHAAQEAGLSH